MTDKPPPFTSIVDEPAPATAGKLPPDPEFAAGGTVGADDDDRPEDAGRPRDQREDQIPAGGPKQFPKPNFRTLKDFCADYVPLAEVVEGMFMSGCLYTLTATTGTGKTAFLTTTVLAGVTGRDLLGLKVQRGRYAICTAENPDGAKMRLKVACFHWRIDMDAVGNDLIISDNRVRPEEICEFLKEEARNGPFTGIFVDTWQAFFDGQNASNPTEAVAFTRRFRPLTFLPGSPAVIVCAHPNKGAGNDALIPSGGGTILNEIDGNLILAMQPNGLVENGWQGKLRGFHFEPRLFRIENLSSPDVLNIKGEQIPIPVMFPTTLEESAARDKAIISKEMRLLKAISENPGASVTELATKSEIKRGSISRTLERLASERPKVIHQHLGKWTVTKAGKDALENRLTPETSALSAEAIKTQTL